jgi:hypothetical protein
MKLSQHNEIKMLPKADDFCVVEGECDPIGEKGLVLVAGAGFEPATFGL